AISRSGRSGASTASTLGRGSTAGDTRVHAAYQAHAGARGRSTMGLNAAIALLIAVALDRAFGEPPNAIHPVAWMGTAIAWGRNWALCTSRVGQFVRGTVVALTLPIVCAVAA